MRFLDDTTEEDEVKYTVTKPALSEEIPTTITGWENDPRVQKEAEIYLYELSKLDNTFDPGSYFDDNKDIAESINMCHGPHHVAWPVDLPEEEEKIPQALVGRDARLDTQAFEYQMMPQFVIR